MTAITINSERLSQLRTLLSDLSVPIQGENLGSLVTPDFNEKTLANGYLFLVAICHQTSPIGERRLEGTIATKTRYGWDYLKEKYFLALKVDPNLALPEFWAELTPDKLSEIFRDPEKGLTLNRINERAYLLNNLGGGLAQKEIGFIYNAFVNHQYRLGGERGFLAFLSQFQAFSDPLRKKTFFFISLAMTECNWKPVDIESLLSPVDYHEIRGHLRIGTIQVSDNSLARKIFAGQVLSEAEDFQLRETVQNAMRQISRETGIVESQLHYLFWNVFRYCCPRDSSSTHCHNCGENCRLPVPYKDLAKCCVFADVCASKEKPEKVIEPGYFGHYY